MRTCADGFQVLGKTERRFEITHYRKIRLDGVEEYEELENPQISHVLTCKPYPSSTFVVAFTLIKIRRFSRRIDGLSVSKYRPLKVLSEMGIA